MNRILTLDKRWALAIYAFADIICVGMGMGVPIFCILLGFVVGGAIALRVAATATEMRRLFAQILLYATITSGVTFLLMAVLWGPMTGKLFDPSVDLEETGVPMILYEPRASFIGWQVLMIVISPFLQALATVFAANLTLVLLPKGGGGPLLSSPSDGTRG